MDLFVTRVSDFDIPDIDSIGLPIINHLKTEEKERVKAKQYSMRGKTGYHSSNDLCCRSESWSYQLKSILHMMLSDHAEKEKKSIAPLEVCRIECWGMIMREGDFSSFHNHPGSIYSGVLYLKVPKLENNEGQLVFVDPRSQIRSVRYSDQLAFHRITPKKGDAYIFPYWLDHFVDPHFSNDERISLSFNLVDLPEYF